MAPYRVALRPAEVDIFCRFLAGQLAINPLFDFRSSKPPELPNVDTTNNAFAGEFLQRLRMNLHNGSGFIRVQQRFWQVTRGRDRLSGMGIGRLREHIDSL